MTSPSLRAPFADYLGALKCVDGLKGKKIGVDWAYIASVDMILMGVLAKGTPTWNEVREQVAND